VPDQQKKEEAMDEAKGEARNEERVSITPAAKALVDDLIRRHGPLMFHQSGGCCDGSAPMCYPQGDFRVGERDVYLGSIAGCPFYMGAEQYARWAHTHLMVDVVPGRGSGFSLEAPEGVRFIIRSRLLSDAGTNPEDLSATDCPPQVPDLGASDNVGVGAQEDSDTSAIASSGGKEIGQR
jgi:uncharacterized protein (DUF779 family)